MTKPPGALKPAIDLDSPDIEWVKESPVDSLGRVLKVDGVYYRAIYREKVAYAQELISKGLLDSLADSLLIPRQYPELISHPAYGMLMRSETAKWPVRPFKFPLDAVRRAASVWIAINRFLLPNGYALCDGHYGNFRLFGNCVPKWVDIGSIVPLAHMAGVEELLGRLIYPLLILSRIPEYLQDRQRVLKQGEGVAREEAKRILSSADADRFSTKEIACLWSPSTLSREELLDTLDGLMDSLTFEWPRTARSGYRAKDLDELSDPARVAGTAAVHARTILDLVKRLEPREILGVGANKGYFTSMFALHGIEALAIDTDEFSVNTCYHWLQDKPHLRVCCSLDDFETTRHTADMVLALALTHHLTLAAGLTFDQVASRCAQITHRHLIVEFMPNGLGVADPTPNPLPAWYTLEKFLESFRRHFASVQVVPWIAPRADGAGPRILVHCSERLRSG